MASVLLQAGTRWDIYWKEIDDCLAFLFPANLFCFNISPFISPFSPPLALLYIYDTTLESLPVHIHFITSCTFIISCFYMAASTDTDIHTQRERQRWREETAYTHKGLKVTLVR
ncbi:hypothetical protein V8C44DRAFT_169782 [Trichoderma aethiopicum]